MLQHVNTVLVGGVQGATTPTTISAAVAGDIIMVNEKGILLTTEALATAAEHIRLGLVTSDTMSYLDPSTSTNTTIKKIVYSNLIDKYDIASYAQFAYSAPVEDVVVITGTSSVAVVGYRYVLRLIYKDIFEHPGQFTHTYETFASTASIADVLTSLATKINKDPRRRVTASVTASVLTLTALVKDDNNGKESINKYSRVDLNAVMYYTNPDAAGFASKNKYAIASLTIVKTPGTDGKGNPKIVRDREQLALGYRGITNRTHFPVIKPELNVDLSATYDGFVIEFEPEHYTAEDDVRKTKQTVEVYVKNTTALTASMIGKLLADFCA